MEVIIGGKRFQVSRTLSRNRNAAAKLRGGTIHISLPSRWPSGEKERVAENLLRRSIKAIESGRWRDEAQTRVAFSHGQTVTAMGMPFDISFVPGSRFGSRVRGSRIEVRTDDAHPEKDARASAIVRRKIIHAAMPALAARVELMNREHFGSQVRSVRVRDTVSRWGSCSPRGDISLSFRLLFMPQEILDYVIVHELAHTRYRSHGPRFWALVEKAVPDHKERRRWLRENGWAYPQKGGVGARGDAPSDFYEEPY